MRKKCQVKKAMGNEDSLRSPCLVFRGNQAEGLVLGSLHRQILRVRVDETGAVEAGAGGLNSQELKAFSVAMLGVPAANRMRRTLSGFSPS